MSRGGLPDIPVTLGGGPRGTGGEEPFMLLTISVATNLERDAISSFNVIVLAMTVGVLKAILYNKVLVPCTSILQVPGAAQIRISCEK